MGKRRSGKLSRILIVLVFFILFVLFVGYVIFSGLLPSKYAWLMVGVLLLINLVVASLLLSSKARWKTFLSAFLIILVICVYAMSSLVLKDLNAILDKISSDASVENYYSLLSLKSSNEVATEKLLAEKIGCLNPSDEARLAQLLGESGYGPANATQAYEDPSALVEALYTGQVQVIFFNESFRKMICLSHPDFNQETTVLLSSNDSVVKRLSQVEEISSTDETYEPLPEDKIQAPEKGEFIDYEPKVVTGQDPFLAIVSGIDTYGDLESEGCSDVNIVVAVNPTTNKVLIVPIPRDAYVTVAGTGHKDKLTHAGYLGVEATMKSVANVIGIPIDIYVKVNFDTLVGLVDTLGGITVNNPQAFNVGPLDFPEGKIWLDGKKTLVYSRERYSLPRGDFDRGINQTRVMQSIIDEVTRPDNLLNYSKILEHLSDSFSTNLSEEAIRTLVKEQLNSGAEWDVKSTSISASGKTGLPSYMMPGYNLYFAILEEASVDEVSDLLLQILEE